MGCHDGQSTDQIGSHEHVPHSPKDCVKRVVAHIVSSIPLFDFALEHAGGIAHDSIVEDSEFAKALYLPTKAQRFPFVDAIPTQAALNTAQRTGDPFRVVTVDIGLGQSLAALDGEDILAFVNQNYEDTKCIVVTGHASVGTKRLRKYFKEFEVFDFVEKADFDISQFKQIVDKAFDFHGYRILADYVCGFG